MMIPCSICGEKGTVHQGRVCSACGGIGEVEAPDGFHMSEAHKIAMFRMIVAATGSINDICDKVNDIKEKVDEIKKVVDNL